MTWLQAGAIIWKPSVDRNFVQDSPYQLLLDGKVAQVPLVTGAYLLVSQRAAFDFAFDFWCRYHGRWRHLVLTPPDKSHVSILDISEDAEKSMFFCLVLVTIVISRNGFRNTGFPTPRQSSLNRSGVDTLQILRKAPLSALPVETVTYYILSLSAWQHSKETHFSRTLDDF